jgi:hypothetical protein
MSRDSEAQELRKLVPTNWYASASAAVIDSGLRMAKPSHALGLKSNNPEHKFRRIAIPAAIAGSS